jgi:simple sugar transport system permease protein
MTFIIDALVTIIGITTPILLAASGELVVEKSGVINLGVEGMMLVGAIAGFAVTFETGNPWLGIAVAMLAGSLASLIFGVLVLSFGANQVATGLALTIFGIGLSSLIGSNYVGIALEGVESPFPSFLSADPFWRLIFGHSPFVYFAIFLILAIGYFLNNTRAGLVLRAVGENDHSAHSIGYSVLGIRYAAIAFGGAIAGLAGADFSMVISPLWAEQMTAGRGWIALALVVFAGWRAGPLLAGAYFFGVLMALELYAKASGYAIMPSQFWAAMPYLIAVIVLAIISSRDGRGGKAPACLGKPFIPNG